MPSEQPEQPRRTDPERRERAPAGLADTARDVRRITPVPGGPMLVEGPVEVVMEDGGTARSDRFTVALCTCRRSRRYPWCDTSHRRRTKPKPAGPAGGDDGTG